MPSRTTTAILAVLLTTFALTTIPACGVDRVDRTNHNTNSDDNDDSTDGCEMPDDGELLECVDRDATPPERVDSDRCDCFRDDLDPESHGDNCALSLVCGDQASIDCGAAAGGSLYYVDAEDGDILGRCGGYCDRTDPEYCDNCPPDDWNCDETL